MFDNCFKGSGQIDKWMDGRREGQKDRRKEGGRDQFMFLSDEDITA